MAIDVKLSHLTRYRYSKPVIMGPQVVRLRPAPHCRTKIISYSFQVKPENNWVNWQQDAFSNHLARLVFPDPIKLFEISVDLVAHMEAYNPFDFFLEESAENYPFAYEENEAEDLKPYLRKSEMGPLLKKWVDAVDRSEKRVIDFLVELNQKINGDLGYLIRMEPGVQTPEETLEKGCGSCRDFAWLFVNILRQLGLAARFVSGYSIQLKADVKALDGPSGVESDVCDLHAWTEVYLPGAGWVGMDATSGLFCGEGHLPLACTPEPRTAAAITGGFNAPDDMEDDFHFEMSVKRVFETPRVTLPYSDEQWSAINALGKKIDKRLRRSDVRLTMGGEPTFVSIDDFESPQWTTDAFGKEKSERSDMLMKMLFEKYGQGGFLHYGQGKWYPGEQLPRWAYSCLWRKDGQRIWNEPELFADVKTDYGFNEHDAENFMAGLIGKLGIDSKFVMNGYEDAWYYMWKERRLPSNVHLHNNKLDDPHERERLAKVFEQGVSKKVGYALPIERGWKNGVYSWVSGPWFLRPEEMFLIPGDSAMGLRLPMDSIPWTASSDLRFLSESSVPEDVPPLPEYDKIAQQYFRVDGERRMEPWKEYMRSFGQGVGKMPPHMRPRPEKMKQPDVTPQLEESAPWIVKTAMCVEPRNGKLHIFMPPVYSMEDYIDLLTALEATATEQDRPIVIEGYLPPYDPRMDYVKITPDPGVIEVNVQPSHSWDHLVEKTKFLYDAARECRLGTEKFDVDGSHTGTGGGNHIVVGGEHPTSSPFLRRPKLLSSLVAYWHNHPSLSYLFSGKFIGPTSQAPRIDEARNDSLYEMEIAFNELNRQLDINNCPPWLVDRIFRNLLIDVTGNTHRAEFCIDKLYSPDSNTGRLGLLEQRAYEMPPHSEMSLTQHLLLRGLIARFWDDPYEPDRLARWGT
ncbi:MAG: transglutaminase family protein, partial [Verrucomicrobiota bacterium]